MSLPRGWKDLAFQISLWLGFVLAYQVARGISRNETAEAFRNAARVVRLERRLGIFVEPSLQRHVLEAGGAVLHAANWTYWVSEFAVVSLALLWVYLYRYASFVHFRNWILLTNVMGLLVYAWVPTAPPRLLPWDGFVDTLGRSEALNHGTGPGAAGGQPVRGDAEACTRLTRSSSASPSPRRRPRAGAASGCCGPSGSRSPWSRRRTTSGPTSSPGSCSPASRP